MKGHVIIRDHPYVGISGEDGVVTIEKLPVGEITFKLVHENMKKSLDEEPAFANLNSSTACLRASLSSTVDSSPIERFFHFTLTIF